MKMDLKLLSEKLHELDKHKIIDVSIREQIEKYILQLQQGILRELSWASFSSFWPPRLIKAYKEDNLGCFFGAGISIPCGLPSWNDLLNNYFELDKVFLADKDLAYDPLTLADIASHNIGADKVQTIIRNSFKKEKMPSVSHYMLASLRLPVYITTNYDNLFELAYREINKNYELHVVVNSSDLSKMNASIEQTDNQNHSVLFKIHGCAERNDEQIILTRTEYRRHYRYNQELFSEIKKAMSERQILFLGFSHSDPEVTRLVEDIIWKYESGLNQNEECKSKPNLYSMQFNMLSHTPEIFAAKGIVALNPPVVESKSEALCVSLCDLIGAANEKFHDTLAIDDVLVEITKKINDEFKKALIVISEFKENAISAVSKKFVDNCWMKDLSDKLKTLSGQGVYLLNDEGTIIDLYVPDGLNKESRLDKIKDRLTGFRERPYFRQAKTYRKEFVSDTVGSVYNGFSTFFLCCPLVKSGNFIGLLFTAAQVGSWKTPINQAAELWKKGVSYLLVDSNGVCLLPPNGEFETEKRKGVDECESEDMNVGYDFNKLISLSRKDKVVARVMENVVPIGQDDDVLNLSTDLKYYSVISELSTTRWKVAISKPIILSKG